MQTLPRLLIQPLMQPKITGAAIPLLLALNMFMGGPLTAQTMTGASNRGSDDKPDYKDDARQTMIGALARQRRSVASMEVSIATQRTSVARQVRNAPTGSLSNTSWPLRFASDPAPPACEALLPEEIDSLVNTAAETAAILPDLIRSVMKQESGFRPCAVSPKGAMGLMQLMPPTAGDLGVRDAFDPQENAVAGAKFLKQLMDYYGGNVMLALGAYNAGPRKVDAAMGIPAIPETQDFVRQVLSFLPGPLAAPLPLAQLPAPVAAQGR